jgi:hypothetical protein
VLDLYNLTIEMSHGPANIENGEGNARSVTQVAHVGSGSKQGAAASTLEGAPPRHDTSASVSTDPTHKRPVKALKKQRKVATDQSKKVVRDPSQEAQNGRGGKSPDVVPKRCKTCSGTWPDCKCKKLRQNTRSGWKAKAIADSVRVAEQEATSVKDAAAATVAASREEVDDLENLLDEALGEFEALQRKVDEKAAKEAAEEQRKKAWREKIEKKFGQGFTWETGSNLHSVWWYTIHLGRFIYTKIPGVARFQGFGTPLRSASQDVDYKLKNEMITQGLDTTAFNLTFGDMHPALTSDERPETQGLKDIKYDWALCRCRLTYSNRVFEEERDVDVSMELLMNLTSLSTWDRSMSATQVRDRMVLQAKSFHHINSSRANLTEAVMQNTIMIAVGWTMAMKQMLPELDFCLGATSVLSSDTGTASPTQRYPH